MFSPLMFTFLRKMPVNEIEKLIVTVEAMAVRCKPGGRLAELQADLKAQKQRQDVDGDETHPLDKY